LEERAREQAGGVEIIDYLRMVEEYRVEGTVVVDARSEDFYLFEHIPGARSLPLEKADDMISDFLAGIPEGTRLIVYCDGPSCPAARELGAKLTEAGHKDVAVYIGGMEEWSMEGGPVTEGEQG
jgi:rhodanese-related sulfurtransferase